MKINFSKLVTVLAQILVAAPAIITAAKPVVDAAKSPTSPRS